MNKAHKTKRQADRQEKNLRRVLEASTIETARVRKIFEFVKSGVWNGFVSNGKKV